MRSRLVADYYATARGGAASVDGSVLILWSQGAAEVNDPAERGYRAYPLNDAKFALAMRFGPGDVREWDAAGFMYRGARSRAGWARLVGIPHWALAAMFALAPLFHAVRILRELRPPGPGHCRHCGYDLTGNVSGVCPECGRSK